MKKSGIGADLNIIKQNYLNVIHQFIADANLLVPETSPRVARGKQGFHSEKLGYILAELQYMQRAYPNMQW